MSLVQPFQIAAAWHEFERPAPVHQTIVNDEVQQAVTGHAGADPFQGMGALRAGGNQNDRQHGEHQRIQVVLFEPAVAGLVVRAMPAPAPPMHQVFMGQVGHPFHGGQGNEEDQGIDDHGYSRIHSCKGIHVNAFM